MKMHYFLFRVTLFKLEIIIIIQSTIAAMKNAGLLWQPNKSRGGNMGFQAKLTARLLGFREKSSKKIPNINLGHVCAHTDIQVHSHT